METEEAPGRRNTGILAEIPVRIGQLRVSPEPLTPVNMNTRVGLMNGDTPRHPFINGHNNNTPAYSAYLSPTPSPDEMVIQQRGRRRIPTTYSPDIDYKKSSPFTSLHITPPKVLNLHSPLKNGVVTRSTPRKRLLMNDFDKPGNSGESSEPNNDAQTPLKYRNQSPTKNSPAPKRFKIECPVPADSNKEPLAVLLKAMSVEQLINIVKGMVDQHPELEEEIRISLPAPDLKPIEDHLTYLKKNIFKSLPTSRLYSKTDSPAYSRASTHMIAFKKYLVEQGKTLTDSHNWHTVLEYSIMAWSYVRGTPLWDNHPHNAVRLYCFKYLAGLALTSLRRINLDQESLLDIKEKFENMLADSDNILCCLKHVEVQIKSGPQNASAANSSNRRGI